MSIITFLLAIVAVAFVVWQLAKRGMFSTFGAWIRGLFEKKKQGTTQQAASNKQPSTGNPPTDSTDSPQTSSGQAEEEENRDVLLPPRRSVGAWIRDLLWIAIPCSIVFGIGYLLWKAGGWVKTSVQSIEIDFSFSTDWFWAALSHPVTWVIAAIILLVLFAYRMYRSGKTPEWKSVKEFGSNTMYVVLFIGASLVLFYGAIYLKNHISADSSTTRTIVATEEGTTVAFSCPYQYKWENGQVRIFDRDGRLIHNGSGHVDHGRSADLSRQTFYGDNISVVITEEASC